jgi:hypothetical protein
LLVRRYFGGVNQQDEPFRVDQFWQPATFLERGVAVPFTTPALLGARARVAARGVELVVPHPAGARGVYIMTCSEVGHFCAATLHDLRLADRLAAATSLSPAAMRELARGVALEGLAGRAARQAAIEALETKRTARLLANIALLQALVMQSEGGTCAVAELDRHAKAAILRLAPGLGRAPEAVTDDIEALAGLLAPLGLGAAAASAPLAGLLVDLGRLEGEVSAQGGGQAMAGAAELPGGGTQMPGGGTHIAVGATQLWGGATQAGLGGVLVASAAASTAALAQRALEDARARAGDMAGLLAAWCADRAATAARLTRGDWLLDGWEQICLIWHLSGDANRRGCLSEMALMVPMLPREAADWAAEMWAGETRAGGMVAGAMLDNDQRERLRKLVAGFENWRTGSLVFDLIARNERVRALAA